MTLPISPPFPPMEARPVDALPSGDGWWYEPKWDGFRCLAFRDGASVELQSKAGQPLQRYFPELVEALAALDAPRCVLDGEIVVAVDKALSFDDLLQRIHPAASRVAKLAGEHPATLVVFDLLVDQRGQSLLDLPLRERRARLEAFAAERFPASNGRQARLRLSPGTADRRVAQRWFGRSGATTDGVIAKRAELPYAADSREGMVKIKKIRTADCVVGGFRYAAKGGVVGSLLLGLYDDQGLLHHVGFTSTIRAAERPALTRRLEALVLPPGFTGRAPGGPSRWSTERSTQWKPLAPELVVEVAYDHVSGGRFRHGTTLQRWRPDKAPKQCTMEQLEASGTSLESLLG